MFNRTLLLCRLSHIPPLSAWVSYGFSGFLPLSRNTPVGDLAKIIDAKLVNESLDIVMVLSYVSISCLCFICIILIIK